MYVCVCYFVSCLEDLSYGIVFRWIQVCYILKCDSINFFLYKLFFIELFIGSWPSALGFTDFSIEMQDLFNKIVLVISLVLNIYNYCVIINKNT